MSGSGRSWFAGIRWTVIRVEGKDGLDLLHRLSTNDILGIQPGECRPTVLTTEKGRVIDLLHVVPLTEGAFLLVGSPKIGAKLLEWFERFTIREDVRYIDLTDSVSVGCSVHEEGIARLTSRLGFEPDRGTAREVGRDGARFVAFRPGSLPFDMVFVVRTGLPGAAGGRELIDLFPLESGDSAEAVEFDHLRIQAGVPLAPFELSDRWTPYEAGLKRAISFTKGCYVGQEVITRLDTFQKVRRGLAKLRIDKRLLGDQSGILLKDSGEVGVITSTSTIRLESGYPALGVVRLGDVERGEVFQLAGGGGEVVVDSLLDDEGNRWV